jgi:phosphopantothenoylcysteine synthetase/decarboxylase
MALFSKKKKLGTLQRELDTPAQKNDLQEAHADYGFGEDFYSEPKQLPAQPQRRQPVYAQNMQEPMMQVQQSLAPRSITESNYEIILSKIDVIDAKLDGISRRMEMVERALQSLQPQPSQEATPYKGYQRRSW